MNEQEKEPPDPNVADSDGQSQQQSAREENPPASPLPPDADRVPSAAPAVPPSTPESVPKLEPAPPTEREREIARLSSFPDIPFDAQRPTGVLLSDEIEYYAANYQMIWPYKPANLKPAGYELSVGQFFAIDGKIAELRDGEKLVVEPFSVAIIQTLETLNLPRHLIARWNVRTRWAYKGLLWVGAAQVDAGFRGYLACPLYNLSNKPVEVTYGTEIAVIDFVSTTPPNANSRTYDWRARSRVTFREYEPEKLLSALATDVKDKLASFKQDLEKMGTRVTGDLSAVQSRVDTFTSSTFAVLAMLFAALGWAVAKNPEPSIWSSTIWLAALALWFAMRSYVLTKSRLQYWARQTGVEWGQTQIPWRLEVGLGVALAIILVVLQYNASKTTVGRLSEVQSELNTSVQELKNSRSQIDELKTKNSQLVKQIEDLRTDVEVLKKGR